MKLLVTRSGNATVITLVVVAIGVLAGLVVMSEMQRRATEKELMDVTKQMDQIQNRNTEENKEAAAEIVSNVRKLIDIPADIEPTVATIVDVETLRQQNPFYLKAQNGNHLIVTPERAILYDSEMNKIIDVVPVQVQQAQPAADAGTLEEAVPTPAEPEPAPEPAPEPDPAATNTGATTGTGAAAEATDQPQ